MNTLLVPFSWVYGRLVQWHRIRLQKQKPQRLPVPVISIGNITVGGTGKTEMAALVCRELLAMGWKPAILSRGYHRKSKELVLVVSEGQGLKPEVSVAAGGDEPYSLAVRLPQVAVVVGTDRHATGLVAIQKLGCTALVLDDGFQRRDEVARDLDIVLVDAADPWGGSHMLPAGRLREPLNSLAEADVVVLTRADQYARPTTFSQLAELAPGKPVFAAQHAPKALVAVQGKERKELEYLRNRRVIAVAGIARPDSFVRTLEKLKADVVTCMSFPDHHWFTPKEFQHMQAQTRTLDAELVTTTKDAVRLGACGQSRVPIWALEVEMELAAPSGTLRSLLKKACEAFQK